MGAAVFSIQWTVFERRSIRLEFRLRRRARDSTCAQSNAGAAVGKRKTFTVERAHVKRTPQPPKAELQTDGAPIPLRALKITAAPAEN